MKNLLFCFLAFHLLITVPVSGQYYNTGQDPSSLKWMKINTGRFKVIYPESYGKEGINFARALERAYSDLTSIYPSMKFRIPVIIHNYTTESNGYVAWAPSRMEIYPTPEQNSIPLDADRQLALHELTHVFQMESLNSGFTGVMSVIAGQQFPGIVSSLLPFWFLEGDAVFSESALTESGRGRTPSFQKNIKAIVLEKGNMYNYDKILNGSFRDFVPDYYETGFQMVTWADIKYGTGLWRKTLNTTADLPFLLNPVNLSLRKNASLTKKKVFQETFDTLKTIWKNDDLRSHSKLYKSSTPQKKGEYVSYHSPVTAGNDSIIAIKTSLSRLPSFVLINQRDSSESRLLVPGYISPYYISYAKGKLVWVETHYDPRWENRSWSVIRIMDLKSKRTRKLTARTRFLSASISPDGKYIAATENLTDNSNNLVILDAENADILGRYPSPGNAYLQRPQWEVTTSEKLTVIYLTERGEGIMCFNTREKSWSTLVEAGKNDIQSSCLRNDTLFYVSSASGTDNIYFRENGHPARMLTRSRFGISDLSADRNDLLFADYTSSGNKICYLQAGEVKAESETSDQSSSFLLNKITPGSFRPEATETGVYNPVRYHKWEHLFRFHSWMPFYADIEKVQSDPSAVTPGVTLMTQNDLSTLISTIGYEYSQNRHFIHTRINWLGWYLALESSIDYGGNPIVDKFSEAVPDPVLNMKGYEIKNTVSLPLFFYGGRFSKYLYLSVSSALQNNYLYIKDKSNYDSQQNQITGRIFFSSYQRSALRDIYPRWAQTIDLSFSYYPFDRSIYGDLLTAKTAFFFPGILRNDGIKLRVEAEKQNPEKFILNNRASFSRSYNNIISKDLRFISADYFLPLAYPDFNISSLLYITRIRTDFFYDYTKAAGNYLPDEATSGNTGTFHDYTEYFRSFGVELMSDFYVLRIPFMVSAGVQAAWRKAGETPYFRLLLNINLFGMNIGKRGI